MQTIAKKLNINQVRAELASRFPEHSFSVSRTAWSHFSIYGKPRRTKAEAYGISVHPGFDGTSCQLFGRVDTTHEHDTLQSAYDQLNAFVDGIQRAREAAYNA